MFIKKQEERRSQRSRLGCEFGRRLAVRSATGRGRPVDSQAGRSETPALRQNESCCRQASCSVFARDQKLSIETRRVSRAISLTCWHDFELSHLSITLD